MLLFLMLYFLGIKKPAYAGFFMTPYQYLKMVPGAGLEPARFEGGGF